MVNKIWGSFIIIGIVTCLLTSKVDLLNKEILECTKTSLEMIFKIFPVMALWLGIMKIASESGLLKKFSNLLLPLFKKLFPEIPNNHESIGYISSNIVANMFGLGNAATPFGLKAMKSLQEINKNKDTASRSMITFLVLNTSGVTIVPTTIISLRMMHGSSDPACIILACILATFISTFLGLCIDRFLAKGSKNV